MKCQSISDKILVDLGSNSRKQSIPLFVHIAIEESGHTISYLHLNYSAKVIHITAGIRSKFFRLTNESSTVLS